MDSAKGKILLVDDEKALCSAITRGLKRLGYHVTEAHNGEDALRLLTENKFDIVISDILMPDCDGFNLISRLQQYDTGKTPFLFVSGSVDVTTEDAKTLGAQGIITKPFCFEQLQNAIAEIIKSSRHCTRANHSPS